MQCLTLTQISDWLSANHLPESPYHEPADSPHRHYLQCSVPTSYLKQEAFMACYYEQIIPDAHSLIHITDWGLYRQTQMIAVTSIRSTVGESRNLVDAPGLLLDPQSQDHGIALFSLTTSFAWSSCLYSPPDRCILHNWEGELFHFWTDSDSQLHHMKTLIQQFNLQVTTES